MPGADQRTTEDHSDVQCVDAAGPWPFVTRRVFQTAEGTEHVWSSRHHRKGLHLREAEPAAEAQMGKAVAGSVWRCLWMPERLNWWIGVVFAVGSLLFALASVLSLAPSLAQAWSLDSTGINTMFFAGSIPFTTAAYLQLFQAANAGEFPLRDAQSPRRPVRLGWRPHDIGWLSSALQFVGTILFNINCFDALLPSLDWLQQDLVIWAPDIAGSILFLASGYLAFIETCHAHWAWKPSSISWWVVFINLLGCVGFMISAVFAFVLPGSPNMEAVTLAVGFTLIGSVGFLVGSLLMLPEMVFQDAH
jgi:preprotein translocase subunit Sss1